MSGVAWVGGDDGSERCTYALCTESMGHPNDVLIFSNTEIFGETVTQCVESYSFLWISG